MSQGTICLKCRKYITQLVSEHACRCRVPMPSDNGVEPVKDPPRDAMGNMDPQPPHLRSKGRWCYQPLEVEVGGKRFRVQASGTVYLLRGQSLQRVPEDQPDGLKLAKTVRDRARAIAEEQRQERQGERSMIVTPGQGREA